MAASSTLSLASCKGLSARASCTWSSKETHGQKAGEVSCALRSPPTTKCVLRKTGPQKPGPFLSRGLKSRVGFPGASNLLTLRSAKAAALTYTLSLEALATAEGETASTSGGETEQIVPGQEALNGVADASQLSFDDVISDAKERVADVLGDAQERVRDATEGTRSLFEESGEKVGALQDLPENAQEGVGDLVNNLPEPKTGGALQGFVEGAQDRMEDAGDALQDLVEGTQDRLETAQDAVKAFADKLTSKSAEPVQPVEGDAGEALPDLVGGTQERAESAEDAVKAFADKLTGESTGPVPLVEGAQDKLGDAGDALPGLVDGTQDSLKSAQDAVKALDGTQDSLESAQDAVKAFFDKLTSDSSESVPLAEGAQDTVDNAGDAVQGLAEGTQDRLESAQDAAEAFTDKLTGESAESVPFVEGAQDKADGANNALQDLVEGTQDRLESAQDAFKAFAEKLTSKSAGSAPSAEGDAGEALPESVEGTQDTLESAQDAAKAFTDTLTSEYTESIPSTTEPPQTALEPPAPPTEKFPETLSFDDAPQKFPETLSAPSLDDGPQESLQSLGERASNGFEIPAPSAIEGAQESASQAAEDGGQALSGAISSFKESAGDSVNTAQESGSDAVDSAGAAFGAGKASVDNVLQDAQETLNSTVGGATDAVQSAIAAAKQAYQDSLNGIFGAVHSVQDTLSNTVDSTTKSVAGAGSQLTSQADSVLRPLRDIGRPIQSAIDQASAGLVNTAAKVLQEVEGVLPPEAREAFVSAKKTAGELSGPLQDVLKQVGQAAGSLLIEAEKAVGFNPNDPAVVALLAGGGVLALAVTWWFREVGYGGDLTPDEALDLLQKERSALLVDVRPQKLRDAYGIPALKRGARFKLASVDPEKLDNSVRKLVRDATAVEYQILAAKIKGLKNVGSGSTVVVMDDNGATSKEVARAVARVGVKKAYRLDGGYSAWAASQATREDVPEAPVAILKEEAAFIAEETGVPAPVLATSIGLGVVLGAWALWEYEKTLQLIALIGIASSMVSRARTYRTVDDFKADVRSVQKPFQLGTTAILSLFGLVDKSVGTPKLATSTSGSAQASGQEQAPENEDFDDPVVEEQEENKQVPLPVASSPMPAASSSTGPPSQE